MRDQPWSLVEGDYIETAEGLMFAVKGLLHPRGRVIAYLRYVPDSRGERCLGDRRYRRVYDLEETTELLRRRYPRYLNYVGRLGLTLQAVPRDRIAWVYRPRERLRALMLHPETELEETAASFASAISLESIVPLDDLGISGSVLVGLAAPSSDIDLIAYGRETGRRVYGALRRLREGCEWISPYDRRTVGKVLRARWGDTGLDLERLWDIEIGKALHGLVSGRDYFVRLVKGPEESEALSRPLGKMRLRAVVIDARDSIFTPCTYGVSDCIMLNGARLREVSELVSFRGKFTEQAREGDAIEARGTLEEVTRGSGTTYRVMLSAKGDYLIPIDR